MINSISWNDTIVSLPDTRNWYFRQSKPNDRTRVAHHDTSAYIRIRAQMITIAFNPFRIQNSFNKSTESLLFESRVTVSFCPLFYFVCPLAPLPIRSGGIHTYNDARV